MSRGLPRRFSRKHEGAWQGNTQHATAISTSPDCRFPSSRQNNIHTAMFNRIFIAAFVLPALLVGADPDLINPGEYVGRASLTILTHVFGPMHRPWRFLQGSRSLRNSMGFRHHLLRAGSPLLGHLSLRIQLFFPDREILGDQIHRYRQEPQRHPSDRDHSAEWRQNSSGYRHLH